MVATRAVATLATLALVGVVGAASASSILFRVGAAGTEYTGYVEYDFRTDVDAFVDAYRALGGALVTLDTRLGSAAPPRCAFSTVFSAVGVLEPCTATSDALPYCAAEYAPGTLVSLCAASDGARVRLVDTAQVLPVRANVGGALAFFRSSPAQPPPPPCASPTSLCTVHGACESGSGECVCVRDWYSGAANDCSYHAAPANYTSSLLLLDVDALLAFESLTFSLSRASTTNCSWFVRRAPSTGGAWGPYFPAASFTATPQRLALTSGATAATLVTTQLWLQYPLASAGTGGFCALDYSVGNTATRACYTLGSAQKQCAEPGVPALIALPPVM